MQSAQRFIDRLNPKVQIHIHPEAPLPSIGLVKKLSVRASEICALEDKIKALSDDELKAKTVEFKARISQGDQRQKELNMNRSRPITAKPLQARNAKTWQLRSSAWKKNYLNPSRASWMRSSMKLLPLCAKQGDGS